MPGTMWIREPGNGDHYFSVAWFDDYGDNYKVFGRFATKQEAEELIQKKGFTVPHPYCGGHFFQDPAIHPNAAPTEPTQTTESLKWDPKDKILCFCFLGFILFCIWGYCLRKSEQAPPRRAPTQGELDQMNEMNLKGAGRGQ